MSEARARILARLRGGPRLPLPERPDWRPPAFTPEQRLDRFQAMLEAVHGEVHRVTAAEWSDRLRALLRDKGVGSLMVGADCRLDWDSPRLVRYDRPVEELKDQLVHEVEAGFTTTAGGIAETGSLVLWPTPAEPRLLSLLPPIHVALVEASKVTDSLARLMEAAGWAGRMPTNALLVSGPSKTADIEQTLAYGVHGPKQLIVLLVVDA